MKNDFKQYIDSKLRAVEQNALNNLNREIQSHAHNGLQAQRVNIFDIFGNLQTVTEAPSEQPQDLYGQVVIYNAQLYWYDFLNKEWQTAGGGKFSVTADTNGTTNVDVFSSAGAPFALTITSVYVISKDTTAGNITVLQGGNTVCTIAKGTTAGAMIGATSLSNTVYAKGDVFQVDSSSTGNASVIINYEV